AQKLRVKLRFWNTICGTSHPIDMPAALFSDGPTVDRQPFVMHCSECGAPTKEGATKCTYCDAPFSWRITETAFGVSGLALDFPVVHPGTTIEVIFSSRSRSA